jgi:two-component sensor histidine kinase
MGIFKYICFFIFFLVSNLQAIDINPTTSNISLLDKASIHFDPTGQLNIKDINTTSFQPSDKKVLMYGFQPDAVLWIHLPLYNNSKQTITKTIVYEDTVTDNLRIYYDDKEIMEGKFFIPEDRKSLYPSFNVTLKPYETKDILIKAYSEHSSLVAKITLYNPLEFMHKDFERKLYIFSFFAILMVLFIYNFFIWLFTNDKSSFYYLLYLGSVIFFQSNYLEVSHIYFFSPEVSETVTKANMLYISLMVISIILFTREFLETSQFKKLDTLLKGSLYLSLPIALLSYSNILFNMNAIIIFIPIALLVIFTVYYSFFKGIKQAKYYMIGWTIMVVSLFFLDLQTIGLWNIYEYMPYLNEVAFILETLLFSIALAHRINLVNEAKQQADEKLIQFQKTEQKRLELLVSEQTQEIKSSLKEKEILYKELNHRIKNNIQIILSLLTLQIGNTHSSETKEELTFTKNRINSLLGLYDKLYLNAKKSDIHTKSYLNTITQTIQKSFNKPINITLSIEHNLHHTQLIYCGLIVNELVTNSFKYAFANTGSIRVILYKKANQVHLIVEDNGIGIQNNHQDSLGMVIVEALVYKQLLGTMEINSNGGTQVKIVWEEHDEKL